MPKADPVCLRQLLGFLDFDPVKETLIMFKPVYGLRAHLGRGRSDIKCSVSGCLAGSSMQSPSYIAHRNTLRNNRRLARSAR